MDHFLLWCDQRGLELVNITPGLAGEFINTVEGSTPTKNQALAALRHFFDAIITRHAVDRALVAGAERCRRRPGRLS